MNDNTTILKYSIIVPVYNVEKYLAECVDSLLAQDTEDSYEIILVDDGSQDISGELCDKYAAKDPRVRVLHKKNGGVSSARNAGMEKARGTYLLFVDPDDWCESNWLSEISRKILEAPDVDMILYGFETFGDGVSSSTIVPNPLPVNKNGKTYLEQLDQCGGTPTPMVWCHMFRTTLLRRENIRFNEEYCVSEDMDFVTQYAIYAIKFEVISRVLYHYRVRAGSLIRTGSPEKNRTRLMVAEKWFDWSPSGGRANQYTSVVIAILRQDGANFMQTAPVRWDIMKQVTTFQLKTAVWLFRVLGFKLGWRVFCVLHNIHHGFKDSR